MKKKFAVLTSGWSVDYVTSCLEGMQEICSSENADLYVFCCYKYLEPSGKPNTTGFAIFDLINFTDYDGIVIMPNLFNDDDIVEQVRKRIVESGVPAISLGQNLNDLHFLNSHNYDIYKELILHLINHHNCRDFAFIGGPNDNKGAISNKKAFIDALTECNIPIPEDNLYENTEWSYKIAYSLAEKIFTKPKIPQAIVCINDSSAMATTSVAIEHGYRVPDDIKIIGFDDLDVSSKVIPSITSINTNAKKLGSRAISILLSKPEHLVEENIPGYPVYRQSCGCQKIVSNTQILFSQSFTSLIDKEQRFSSQMRHLEDTFINSDSVDSVGNSLQRYFEVRHSFEGDDFAIMINESGIENLRNEVLIPNNGRPFDSQLEAIVSIKNGKASQREKINVEDLIPSTLADENPCMYLFLPIYNKKYIYGYYVSQNYLGLLESKSAYNWIRNFGGMLEKYRQTSVFRITSENYKILSTHDAMTGLYNRAGLDHYGQNLYETNRRNLLDTTILFIDINDMKYINDRYGHLQGDLAIKTVAESIKNCIPEHFIAIRYGGDEFVVIGEKIHSDFGLNSDLSSKIKREIKAKIRKMELPYEISVSCGSKSFAATENLSLEEVIRKADEVMYKEKVKFHAESSRKSAKK